MEQLGQIPSSSTSNTLVYNENEESPPEPFPARNWEYSEGFPIENGFSRAHYMRTENEGAEITRKDNGSCFFVILASMIFFPLTMLVGFHGSTTMKLGPYSSILIKPNPIFVEYVKVDEFDLGDGPMLYGLNEWPLLDVVTTWSEIHKTTFGPNTHKNWIHFLNEGSQINISYNVNPPSSSSPSSSSLVLIISQGNEALTQWINDPSYPQTTLSQSIINGNGTIQHYVSKSSYYYIAVGNLNSETVEVHLNFTMKAFLYNTTGACYKCTPAHGECVFNLPFPSGKYALLTSPGRKSGMTNGVWQVELSYGPRWIIYIVGIGGIFVLLLLVTRYLNCSKHASRGHNRDQSGATRSDRNPLLPDRDADLSSECFSHDSDDEFSKQVAVGGGLMAGMPVKDDDNMMRLCAICYDAPRDSFFLPCGHCVACFSCATRIAEAVNTCPICRRHLKKVRKIYTA